MKANSLLSGAVAALLLAGCAARTPPPAPAPVASPEPAPAPSPAPPPPPRPAGDWREAPITPGTWRWSMVDGQSTARFAQPGLTPLVELTCLRDRGVVRLAHAGEATMPVPLVLVTTSGTFPLLSDPAAGTAKQVAVLIPARDRSLDALAFSRGRFAIEVTGLSPSYLPAWPEVARVIEDCR
ncbi:hypothetical protein [Novosphingobium sp.]|uniref:hypothetical protein n=1 Tax=Novosphingobium sp. TaxID=1874826 RepID=UPI0022C01448|nr:hypothetical protein [Novosphingobium sp.]MCZ8019360.1 hypothetical protein [Novosphingobium sp.]MCZ8035175.1 hypothetical protein [Novosphingobium sp.]MCZ8050489.1 hypothetical protein [Novosphingobium sp.]MCZ8058835.1 hypothetical protein [Novosphingobium sp.]MCZ8232280.1 hypothetical protein [Novosphingobium sp.]